MFPQDNNSLLGAIQGYYQLLDQQRLAEQGMGINPQIQQAQDANNLSLLQAAQKAGQMQPQAPVQPVTYDPNNSQANLAKSLMASGPGDFIPSTVGPRFAGGVAATPGATQAGTRDWMRAIDNANFWDKSSFYGGGLRQMSPEEYAKAQLSAETAGPMAAQGILAQIEKQQGVQPKDLQPFLAPAGQVAAAGRTADAAVRAAQLDKEGKIGAAEATGKAAVEAEQIKAGGAKDALTKSTRAQMEQKIAANNNTLSSLNNIAKTFNPKFFTYAGQWGADLTSVSEKLGLDPSKEGKKFLGEMTEFRNSIKDVFNQYRKSITGAAASVQELKALEESIFNEKMSPTEAKSALVTLMVKMQTESYLANQMIQNGVADKYGLTPGTQEFGDFVGSQFNGEQGAMIREQVKAQILKAYPGLNPDAPSAENPGIASFNNGNAQSPMQMSPALIAEAKRRGRL